MFHLLFVSVLVQCTISYGIHIKPRIINGIPSDPKHFPFYVYFEQDGLTCGGTLLSDKWIVTAAQCLRWKNTINVHIGIGSNGVASKQIAVPPSNQYIYPEFGEYRKFHDIGLIELPRSISPVANAMPAKLPSRCSSFPSGFEKVVAVGNGAVNIGQSSHKLLRQATFTTTNASECSSRVSSNAVEGAIICAYPLNDSAVFTDDAGGPLLQEENGALIGIISFVHIDGRPKKHVSFQTFTYIPFYFNWIAQVSKLHLPQCNELQATDN